MKKIFKYLLWLVAAVVVIIIGFVAFLEIRGIPSYPVQKVEITITPTPEKIERGEKIASMLCNGCHLNFQTNVVTGRFMADLPKEFGVLNTANITQDKQYGIGGWTDGEIAFLLRTGIKKDGVFNPVMPKFQKLSDDDIESIICYLHSDKHEVQASATPDLPCDYSLLSKFLCVVAFHPGEMPTAKIPNPDTTKLESFGKYLAVDLYACYACHSADFKTNDEVYPEKSKGFFGGGNKLLNLEGKEILSGNLTFDETGLGAWSLERFDKALRTGLMQNEMPLRYPMFPHTRLTDLEVKAIYTYLQTVPHINNKIVRAESI